MPIVAGIIVVDEYQPRLATEIAQTDLVFAEGPVFLRSEFIDDIRIVVGQTANLELVQMAVPPVERCLDDQMEHPEIPRRRHDQLPPDWRFDIRNHDAKLRCGELTIRHGAE